MSVLDAPIDKYREELESTEEGQLILLFDSLFCKDIDRYTENNLGKYEHTITDQDIKDCINKHDNIKRLHEFVYDKYLCPMHILKRVISDGKISISRSDEILEIDLDTQKIVKGSMTVKIPTVSEKTLKDYIKNKISLSYLHVTKKRLNTIRNIYNILDIDINDDIKKYSKYTKGNISQAIRNRVSFIVTQNEWQIKDVNLLERVPEWIADAINHNCASALANLYRIKAMVKKGKSIYSMEVL